MPSPTTAELLRTLIPKVGDKFCDRFQSGITDFMNEVANHFEYMYRDDGTLSAQFAADICALPCIGAGTDPDGDPCPVIAITGSATIADGKATLTFRGTNLVGGYSYSIYRRTSDSDPWGAAITTGTTTGSVVTYEDTGLVNDQPYMYKVTVQKGGCPEYSAELSGVTPKECQTMSYVLAGGPDSSNPLGGGITFTLAERTGKLAGTFLLTVFMSNDPTQIGDVVLAETEVSESGFFGTTETGLPAVNYVRSGLDPNKTYYLTFRIKEKSACDYYDMKGSAIPYPPKPNPVSIQFYVSGGTGYIRVSGTVHPLAAPTQIIMYAQDVGNQHPSEGFIPFRNYTPTVNQGSVNSVFAVTRDHWPCNYQLVGQPSCRARYMIYAVVVTARGARSENSNTTLLDAQFARLP